MPTIRLLPAETSITYTPGYTLSSILFSHGITIPLPCGGKGICGGCRVRFTQSAPDPSPSEKRLLTEEEIKKGIRLACQCIPRHDHTVELPQIDEGHPIEADLPPIGNNQIPHASAAVDLGTTTIYMKTSTETLSFWNPQILFGEDIVSRLQCYLQDPCRKALRTVIIEKLQQILDNKDIERIAVSGNPVMVGILEGRDLSPLAKYPFTTGSHSARTSKLGPLKMILLPEIGSFLGSDALSLLAAAISTKPSTPALALDIGTNTEMFLITENRILGTSLPAGPAFEGYGIREGMKALPGAIYQVEEDLSFKTVKDMPEKGLCGSGIISAIFQLKERGLLDCEGRLLTGEYYPFGKVKLYQEDIRAIQLAKAAVYAGAKTLLRIGKVEHIEEILVAGNFGANLKREWITGIRMLPIENASIRYLGNTSLWGAIQAVSSKDFLVFTEGLKEKVEVIQLAEENSFKDFYLEGMNLC